MSNTTKYIIALNDEVVDVSFWMKSTIKHTFCGTLVNQNGKNFYFEMDNDLVIIPHRWIRWMAPLREGDFK